MHDINRHHQSYAVRTASKHPCFQPLSQVLIISFCILSQMKAPL